MPWYSEDPNKDDRAGSWGNWVGSQPVARPSAPAPMAGPQWGEWSQQNGTGQTGAPIARGRIGAAEPIAYPQERTNYEWGNWSGTSPQPTGPTPEVKSARETMSQPSININVGQPQQDLTTRAAKPSKAQATPAPGLTRENQTVGQQGFDVAFNDPQFQEALTKAGYVKAGGGTATPAGTMARSTQGQDWGTWSRNNIDAILRGHSYAVGENESEVMSSAPLSQRLDTVKAISDAARSGISGQYGVEQANVSGQYGLEGHKVSASGVVDAAKIRADQDAENDRFKNRTVNDQAKLTEFSNLGKKLSEWGGVGYPAMKDDQARYNALREELQGPQQAPQQPQAPSIPGKPAPQSASMPIKGARQSQIVNGQVKWIVFDGKRWALEK